VTKTVLALAGGRMVSLLEGGYNPARLAESVAAHLAELLAGSDAAPAANTNPKRQRGTS
jgi:acetoin utilization deacetylase AcuC-like enzyme